MRRALMVLVALTVWMGCGGAGDGGGGGGMAGPDNTLLITIVGQGSVRDAGGYFNCGTSGPLGTGVCYGDASPGLVENLTATAAAGATFTGWSGSCSGSAPACSVTINGHMTVTATFTGGGGGGGGGLGTLAGAPFTPASGGALIIPPTTCAVGGTTAHFSGIVIGFSSYADLCGFAQANGVVCTYKANATIASVDVLKGGLVQTPGAVGPGDYPVVTRINPDADGNFAGAGCSYSRASGTCNLTDSDGIGGTVTISSVTASKVTGTLNNVNFGDGSKLDGPFDVTICNYSLNLCDLLSSDCTTPVCIP